MRYTDFPLLFGPVRISMEGEFGSIYDVHFLQSGNVEPVGNEVIGDEFLERVAAVLLVNKERERVRTMISMVKSCWMEGRT